MNPFKFIFIVMFRGGDKSKGYSQDDPLTTGLFALWYPLCLNLCTIYGYYLKYLREKKHEETRVDFSIIILAGLVPALFLYWKFVYKSKYKKMRKEALYKDDKWSQVIIVWVYILGSFWLLTTSRP